MRKSEEDGDCTAQLRALISCLPLGLWKIVKTAVNSVPICIHISSPITFAFSFAAYRHSLFTALFVRIVSCGLLSLVNANHAARSVALNVLVDNG